ncbi:MAG TPA: TlpA disulfide reductase family protein [Mucilaginibacter sp.]|jgi:peroxiredoxin|nr:TlpA disulfide reductase family protein [Mucilaginibacter sp.]
MKKNIPTIALAAMALFFAYDANAQGNEFDNALANCPKKTLLDLNTSGCLIGVKAPDFIGKTIDGKNVRLSDLKGKVVVLNFWFIACAPCHVEAPALKKIAAQFSKDNVVFVSIARETEDDLKKYLDDNMFFNTNIADKSSDINKGIYHVFGFPTTLVIDKLGKIKYYALGGSVSETQSEKDLNAKLVPAISEALSGPASK